MILLTELDNPNPKVYTTIFLDDEETIRDFHFLEEKVLIVLTVSGFLKIFSLSKRVSTLVETVDLFDHLDNESKKTADFCVDSLHICKRSEFVIVMITNQAKDSLEKIMAFKREP